MTEIWKDIPEYEGLYACSNLGRIKSLTPRYRNRDILRQFPRNKSGYLAVNLCKDKKHKIFHVHKLVISTFMSDDASVIDHIDSNKTNNNLSNLRPCTSRQNVHFYRAKLKGDIGIYYRKNRNAWIARIWNNGKSEFLGYFKDKSLAQKSFNNRLNAIQISAV